MKTDTRIKIINYVKNHGQVMPRDLSVFLNISSQAVFKQLAKLLEQGQLKKIGKPPRVFYIIAPPSQVEKPFGIEADTLKIIDKYFYVVTPSGDKKEGIDALSYWCQRHNLNPAKTAIEYRKTLKKYDAFKKDGIIDGMPKIRSTFDHIWLDDLYYLDFYAIERFGKTKLGQFLLYAKQSQDREQIHALIKTIKPRIEKIIEKHSINGVGFIPPTVKRQVQFMKEMQTQLCLKPKGLSILKIKTPVIVPQKTLNKLEDRIENARNTIIVDERTVFENVLLIDDAVGSGATLNETARQLKIKGTCSGKITGLAITGSFKGFDVISEI